MENGDVQIESFFLMLATLYMYFNYVLKQNE